MLKIFYYKMTRTIYVLFLMFFTILSAKPSTTDAFAAANDAYRSADYHKAVALYHKALKEGPSAEVYYNLGNAYYRTDNIAKALLYYEKAAKMRPTDKDIQHNIEIAQSKTTDRMAADTDIFFIQWYHHLQSIMTINGWAYTGTISLVLALALFLSYLFMNSISIRKMSFYFSVAFLFFFLVSNVFAWQRSNKLSAVSDAIVTADAAEIKVSPTTKATNVCTVHEGTKVSITDHDIKEWYGIHLPDGREGWILRKEVENI